MHSAYCVKSTFHGIEALEPWVSPGFHRGGGARNIIFQIWKFACRKAMRLASGVRGHGRREILFKRCVLVYIWIRFCL